MRVIEGGISPGEPRPIVWNRLPIDGQRCALVLRDSELRDASGKRVDLAWDDGRPWLIGIRTVNLANAPAAIEAWSAHAELCGCEIRDERLTVDPFEAADRENAAKQRRARLEAFRAERERKRTNSPLPVGSLFDTTTRDQGGLF